jgi:uncharacterized RDD family membrane protein YckC
MSWNTSTPAPGWYADPESPGYVRYWDGTAWVPDSVRPAGEYEQPGPQPYADGTAPAAPDDGTEAAEPWPGQVIAGEVIAAEAVTLGEALAADMEAAEAAAADLGTDRTEASADTAVETVGRARTATAARPARPGSRAAARGRRRAGAAATIPGPRRASSGAAPRRRPAPLKERLYARLVDSVVPLLAGLAATAAVAPGVGRHIDARADRIRYEGRTETIWLVDGPVLRAAAVVAAVVLAAMFVYETLPTWRTGRSFGKRLFGLRVVDLDTHRTPTLGRSVLRWATFGVPGLLVIGAIGLVQGALDAPWRQAWHDRAARTFVARDR